MDQNDRLPDELLAKYLRVLESFARSYFGNSEKDPDLPNAIAVSAIRRFIRLHAENPAIIELDDAELSAYLRQVVRYRCLERVRERTRELEHRSVHSNYASLEEIAIDPSSLTDNELLEDLESLDQTIRRSVADDELQQILALYLEGKKQVEIARMLGVSEDVIHRRFRRIIKLLKKNFGRDDEIGN